MRTVIAALLAATLAAPLPLAFHSYAMAGERVYTADEPLPITEQIRRNKAHERQAYDLIIANGGCNSDFNTVEYVTYCHAQTFGAPQMGSQGGE
jgi:hypothetical protein